MDRINKAIHDVRDNWELLSDFQKMNRAEVLADAVERLQSALGSPAAQNEERAVIEAAKAVAKSAIVKEFPANYSEAVHNLVNAVATLSKRAG